MRTQTLLGVLALSLGLMSVPSNADARDRYRSHDRHHGRGGRSHIGLDFGIARHYRAAPVYRYSYRDWDAGYRYSDYDYGAYDSGYGDYDYGYSTYYRSPYVDTYYVRTPRVVVQYNGSRRGWRSHHSRAQRHHRY
jgi:hypothetical protein